MRTLALVFTVVFLAGVGCSSTPKASKNSSGQKLSGTDEQIFVGDTIEKNYDPNVIMKRAESFYDKEEYAEAAIEYTHFLELHRVHTLAPYAQFKLAESYFKQFKTVDRDPQPVYHALENYERLRKDWPGTRWDGDAQERIRNCHNLIAQNYLLVGQFYFRREAYLAAAHRFEAVLTQFPDLDAAGDAMYHLALTYAELGADDWARERLMAFAEQYPNHTEAGAGRRLLAKLNSKTTPDVAVAQAPASGSSISAFTASTTPPAPTANVPAVNSVNALRGGQPSAGQAATFCRLGLWC
ncbi:MAG TPA: outer membrane protein assembly factor BamD [Nitrospirales bacterium]|nr:outer membrane protein assembly factor BamD [Nitrospirales bacterium]